MKKSMLMSALAGAILITTATTSCKKGDAGTPGANGKDATTTKPTTPALAKASVKNSLSAYITAKNSSNLKSIKLGKLTEVTLVTQDEKQAVIDEKTALTTTVVKDAAIKAATDRKKALELIESIKANLSSTLGATSATSAYYASYKTESDKITSANEDGYAFRSHFDKPASGAKNTQSSLLSSLFVIANETGSLTVTAAKIEAELKAATDLKTATEDERTEAIRVANLIKLTDAYGKEVTDASNAVSADQKTAIENYLASKNTLVELINESKAAFGLSFKDLGIIEALQKELGLAEVPVVPAKK